MTKLKGRRCFVISPIGPDNSPIRKQADMVLSYIIKAALPDFIVQRGDGLGQSDMIPQQVINAILDSELVVVDMSGPNANVFYELALRHMKELPAIHIAREGTNIPFDTAGIRTIFYDITDCHSHQKAVEAIKKASQEVLGERYKASNPVTLARGSAKLAQSADSKDIILANLLKRVEELEHTMRLEQAERQIERERMAYSLPPDPTFSGNAMRGPQGPTGPYLRGYPARWPTPPRLMEYLDEPPPEPAAPDQEKDT